MDCAAHQDQRGQLGGGQTNSIGGVDPQQVVGSHVQVMVTMGGGEHAHLPTEQAETVKGLQLLGEAPSHSRVETLTCLSSRTAPTFSSPTRSSSRCRCTVP